MLNFEFHRRLIWKTAIMSLIVIILNVTGNFALTLGLRSVGVLGSWSPIPYLQALAHPWVAAGTFLMLLWVITRLMLLSWADLSYVLPVTSFSFVLSAVVGALYFSEEVSKLQWAGICIISVGVMLVTFTFPETTPVNGQAP